MLKRVKSYLLGVINNYRVDKAMKEDMDGRACYVVGITLDRFWEEPELKLFNKIHLDDLTMTIKDLSPEEIVDKSMFLYNLFSKAYQSNFVKLLAIGTIIYTFPKQSLILLILSALISFYIMLVKERRLITIDLVMKHEHKELDELGRPTLVMCFKSLVVRLLPKIKRRLNIS